jgi:glycine/D-amino acid oxidase-like deaminating enzyme
VFVFKSGALYVVTNLFGIVGRRYTQSKFPLFVDAMSTVIIGGGIIGVSIAYYLSDPELSPEPREIHIVDTSPELFASASGYSAGFLAKDWFASEVEALGELSFELHRDLAKKHNGRELWGYMESTALSLQVGALAGKKAARGDDWLRRGASRAETAARAEEELDEEDIAPLWLTKQAGGIVEKISDSGSVAQV